MKSRRALRLAAAALLALAAAGEAHAQSVPSRPLGLTAIAGNGKITLIWNNPNDSSITKYQYISRHNDTSGGGYTNWTGWVDIPNSAGKTSHTFTQVPTRRDNLTLKDMVNGKRYRFRLRAVNANGFSGQTPPSQTQYVGGLTKNITLSPSLVSYASARLTLENHTGDWWYKRTTPAGGACNSWSTSILSLIGLPGNTNHTYKAYGDSNCAAELTDNASDADFLTRPGKPTAPAVATTAGAGNLTLSAAAASTDGGVSLSKWQYQWKTTTGDFGNEWTDIASTSKTLNRTVAVSGLTAGTSYRFRVRAVNATGGGAPSEESVALVWEAPSRPTGLKAIAGNERVTLLWDNPNDSSITKYQYRARHDDSQQGFINWTDWLDIPGSGSATTGHTFTQVPTLRSNPTLKDMVNGKRYRFHLRAVNANGASLKSPPGRYVFVGGQPKDIRLYLNTISSNAATMYLSGDHTGAWWYKHTTPAGGACNPWTTTGNVPLLGLSGNTNYTYKAYADSNCKAELDDIEFLTYPAPEKPKILSVTGDVVSLTSSVGGAGAVTDWQYRRRPGSSVNPDFGNWQETGNTGKSLTFNVSGLISGTSYEIQVRALNSRGWGVSPLSDPATPGPRLEASDVTATTAVLTLKNHAGAWWYKGAQAGATCAAGDAATRKARLTGLSGGASYAYKAYSDAACNTALTVDANDAKFSTVGLTVESIAQTGAVLRIANWTRPWWHKGDHQGAAQCASVAANDPTDELTGLEAGRRYEWAAYKAAGCGDADRIAETVFAAAGAAVEDRARQVLKSTLAAVVQRTTAGALDNIGSRFADGAAAARLTIAGQSAPLGAGAAPAAGAGYCAPGAAGWRGFGPDCGGAESRAVGWDELVRASAFDIALGAASGGSGAAGPLWSLWGRGDFDAFEGRPEPGASYDGEMRTGWLGFDGRMGPWVGGVAVSHGESETDYSIGGGGGVLETELTAFYPYGRYTLADGFELRGIVGAGTGEARHRPEGGAQETSDLWMRMVSTGLRRALPAVGGAELALRADASAARMETGAGPELVSGITADSWRLRAGLEASRRFALGGGAGVEPFMEAAGRRDGGDGASGTGLEVAGGVRYAAPGVHVEARGRWLAAHSESGLRERGASVTARVGPGAQGRGLSLSLSPRWGADAGSGALWRDEAPAVRADGGSADAGAFDARLGYGFASGPGGLVTPFAEMGLSEGESRRARLGARFEARRDLALELAGERRESAAGPPDAGVRLDLRLRF